MKCLTLLLSVALAAACSPSTGGDAGADVVATDSPSASDVPTTTDVVASDSGGGACDGGACGLGLACCSGGCVNEQNDPLNCGACGHACSGATGMCEGGACVAPTCAPACGATQTCCDVQGAGPSGPPTCHDGPTCPIGCIGCA